MENNQIELKLGKNLQYLIREKGMTIVSLSRKTDIPLQTLHGWLSGIPPKKLIQLKRLSIYFQINMDLLCFGNNNELNQRVMLKQENSHEKKQLFLM